MKRTLAFILTMVMVLSMATFSYAADLEDNLVAYWTFDEIVDTDGVQTIEDMSGNNNTLTIQDTNWSPVTGFTGSAIDFKTESSTSNFAGAKHATMLASDFLPFINRKDGLTVSMWIKRENIGSSAKNTIISIAPTNAVLKVSAERFDFLMESRSNTTETSALTSRFYPVASNKDFYPQIGSVNGPNAHAWVHVTAVNDYANAKQRLYLDGELVGETDGATWKSTASDFAANDASGYIGVGESLSIIDEVKVYNKALTQDEVKEQIPPVLEYNYETMAEADSVITTANATGVTAPITLPESAEVVNGAVGNTIHFGGKGTLPHMTYKVNLLQSRAIGFSTWVRSVDGVVTTKAGGQSIISEGIGGFSVSLDTNGKVRVNARAQHSDGLASVSSPAAVFTAGDTTWHHIAGSVNYVDETVTLYVDGKFAATQDFTDMTDANGKDYFTQPWYFVKAHTASHIDSFDLKNTADVLLDDTKIYRRALTAGDVAAEYIKVYKDFVSAEFEAGGDYVTATCDFFNNTGADIAEDTCMVFLGMYDGNDLVKISALKVPAIANLMPLDDQTVTIAEIDDPTYYTYKLFVWNGTTLEPYYATDYEVAF